MSDSQIGQPIPNEPVSDEQYAAATLPAPESDGYESGSYNTALYPTPAPVRRGKAAVRVLTALTVVFFVAAGTFGTLWFIERGDHKATAGQLNATRGEADDSRTKQQEAEAQAKEAETKSAQAASERAKVEDQLQEANLKLSTQGADPATRDGRCAGAARELTKAIKAGDDRAADTAGGRLVLLCG
jgi:hypothetical protein